MINNRKFIVLAILIAILSCTVNLNGQNREYTIKAAFLERFTRFVEWPDTSDVNDPDKPFVIVTLGDSPFEGLLEAIYDEQKIKSKSVEIHHINNIFELKECNILFISASKRDTLPYVLSRIKGRNILTVGDTEGYAEQGVIVNFYIDDDKIRFEINETAIRENNLIFSSMLLNVARIVHPVEGE